MFCSCLYQFVLLLSVGICHSLEIRQSPSPSWTWKPSSTGTCDFLLLLSLATFSLPRSWRPWCPSGSRRTGWSAWQLLVELPLHLEVNFFWHSLSLELGKTLNEMNVMFTLQALLGWDLPLRGGKPWKSKKTTGPSAGDEPSVWMNINLIRVESIFRDR